MSDNSYSVKINRREGIVEITGTDKEWIAEQIDRLSVVYEQVVAERQQSPSGDIDREGNGSNGDASEKKTSRRRSAVRTATPRPTKKSDLDEKLSKEVMRRMHVYFEERPKATKSHQSRAAVIATFLADELDVDGLGPNDLIAVYRAMGWAPPKDPSAVIKNATERNGYFGGIRDGLVHLTPTGEHFGRHGSTEMDGKV